MIGLPESVDFSSGIPSLCASNSVSSTPELVKLLNVGLRDLCFRLIERSVSYPKAMFRDQLFQEGEDDRDVDHVINVLSSVHLEQAVKDLLDDAVLSGAQSLAYMAVFVRRGAARGTATSVC